MKFLHDNNFDEKKLNDLIELKGDTVSKDETSLVRKLFKGASQSYGDACRYNGRYRPEDIDMESMCAASKRLSMSRSRSPTINEINQKTEEAATVIEDTQPTPVTLDAEKQNGQHEYKNLLYVMYKSNQFLIWTLKFWRKFYLIFLFSHLIPPSGL